MIRLKNTSSLKKCAPCFYTIPNSLSLILSYAFLRNPENFLSNSQFFRPLAPLKLSFSLTFHGHIHTHSPARFSYSKLHQWQPDLSGWSEPKGAWVATNVSCLIQSCQSLPTSARTTKSPSSGIFKVKFDILCVSFFLLNTFMGLVSWKIDVFET